jgi:uncharacterized membrane protein (DUF485 family)
MGYLYSFLKPDHAYFAKWQELRRRRTTFWTRAAFMLLGIVLLWVFATVLCLLFKSTVFPAIATVVTFAAMVTAFVAN